MRRLLILILPILSEAQTLSGTAVVIAWCDSEIVIAADSKLTSPEDSTFSAFTCKIITLDERTIFVHSGIYTDPGGLDMQSSIRFNFRGNRDIDEWLSEFKDSIVQKLGNILDRNKKQKPESFSSFRPLSQASCVVINLGTDSLRMRRVDFSGMVIPNNPRGFWISGMVYDPIRINGYVQKEPFLMPLGHVGTTFCFSDSLRSHGIKLSSSDFPRLAYSLVTLESVLNPRTVGGPIDVVRLKIGKRPEWIHQENEQCK
jgi:hypothetical protein